MKRIPARKIPLFLTSTLLFIFIFCAVKNYNGLNDFHVTYPLKLDVSESVSQLEANQTPVIEPINNFNFTYTLEPKCFTDNSTITLIVKSSTINFLARQTIRKTWGNETTVYRNSIHLKTLFMLGRSEDAEIENQIRIESSRYSDIIQSDFIDTYYNNTIKSMMAMRYALHNCHRNMFFVFVDDDFFISIDNLLRFLESPSAYAKLPIDSTEDLSYLMNSGYLYAGHAYYNPEPFRDKENKWYVPESEYPYFNYPDFVAGGTLVFSRLALSQIYYTSLYVQKFRLDDVFIGMAAAKANIKPTHSDEFHMIKKEFKGHESYKNVISSHGFKDLDEMVNVWRLMK